MIPRRRSSETARHSFGHGTIFFPFPAPRRGSVVPKLSLRDLTWLLSPSRTPPPFPREAFSSFFFLFGSAARKNF